jgi:hypothetical protein
VCFAAGRRQTCSLLQCTTLTSAFESRTTPHDHLADHHELQKLVKLLLPWNMLFLQPKCNMFTPFPLAHLPEAAEALEAAVVARLLSSDACTLRVPGRCCCPSAYGPKVAYVRLCAACCVVAQRYFEAFVGEHPLRGHLLQEHSGQGNMADSQKQVLLRQHAAYRLRQQHHCHITHAMKRYADTRHHWPQLWSVLALCQREMHICVSGSDSLPLRYC